MEMTHTLTEEFSVIIKNIAKYRLNIDFKNDVFKDFNIDKSTVMDVNFKRGKL